MNYIEEAVRTEALDPEGVTARVKETTRLLHAAMGLATEASEFVDAMKKHLFYGKPLDKTNLIEELGDILYYAAIATDELGSSFEEVMQKNVSKLKIRYGTKFTEAAALQRNLDTEKAALEQEYCKYGKIEEQE